MTHPSQEEPTQGWPYQILERLQLKESMHETAIAQISFRGLDKSLLQVRMVRLQLAHDERVLQNVEVMSRRWPGYAETCGDFAAFQSCP